MTMQTRTGSTCWTPSVQAGKQARDPVPLNMLDVFEFLLAE